MTPVSHVCTLATIAGLLFIGAARATIVPPTFVKPTRSVYGSRDELWFQVRITPDERLRTLRVSLWICAMVEWGATFPFQGSTEQAPEVLPDIPLRCEPQDVIRSSDEPLNETARRTFPIRWLGVESGEYEIEAKVITNRGVSVKATKRIQVM